MAAVIDLLLFSQLGMKRFVCPGLDNHLLPVCRGIEQSSSAADVKKAYRKAALKHHPDKVLYLFYT